MVRERNREDERLGNYGAERILEKWEGKTESRGERITKVADIA